MARSNTRRRSQFPATPQGVAEASGFFATINNDVVRVNQWDVSAEQFTQAVLGLLASGRNVYLAAGWQGDELSVIVYEGEGKDRRRARDSMELDSLMSRICDRLREEGIELKDYS